MRSGSVQVGGPLLPERVTLRAGQQLTAKLASGELHIGEARARRRARRRRGGRARADAGAPSPAADPAGGSRHAARAAEPQPAVAAGWRPRRAARAAGVAAGRRRRRARAGAAVGRAGAGTRARPPRRRSAAAPARPSIAHRAPTAHVNPISFAPRTWSSAITTGHAARVVDRGGGARPRQDVARGRQHRAGRARRCLPLFEPARDRGARVRRRAPALPRARRPRTRPRSSWAASPTIAARSRRAWPGTAAISPRRRRGRTRRRRWAGRCSRSSGSPGRDAARSVAAEYVERFPNGTYLLQAHSILANPTP